GRAAFAPSSSAGLDRARGGVILGNIALPTERASEIARRYLGRTLAERLGGPPIGLGGADPHPLNRYVAGLPAGGGGRRPWGWAALPTASMPPAPRRCTPWRWPWPSYRLAAPMRCSLVGCRGPTACTRRWGSASCGRCHPRGAARRSMRGPMGWWSVRG